MPFAAALSEHPLATHAAGEVIGSLLEQIGPEPDVVAVFVTGAHLGALDDICAAVRATLDPGTLLGATAVSVVGGAHEVEEQAAVSAWAGRVAGATAVRLEARPLVEGDLEGEAHGRVDGSGLADLVGFVGLPEHAGRPGSTLLLVADPATFPLAAFLDAAATQLPTLTVVGGVASAGSGGGNRLAVDDAVHTDGAVGVLLGPEWPVTSVVSQGCRPIGDPFTVTRAERSMVYEIAGTPALTKLQEVVDSVPAHERSLARTGLHLGRVVDLRTREPDRGDFLIRDLRGADPDVGALAVADEIDVGTTVQFQVRDAESADEDLRMLLAGATASSALVFTCNGRGIRLFGEPDHDAAMVSGLVGPAVSGMFCAGEVGPIGTRSFLHGFSASIALFSDPEPDPGPDRGVTAVG
ncbi:MAG: FIST signal transduction protein [Acidimicrobiales bacterium]